MAVSMVRCCPVNGPITTDKVHRKYSATLPCAAAINPFPVMVKVTVQLYDCTTVQLYNCTTVQLYNCTVVLT